VTTHRHAGHDADARLEEYRVTRCPRLKAALVDDYYWIVDYVARRYQGRGEPRDDITQAAAVGLVAALDRYDPASRTPFPSFAIPTALGEVRRHFRDRTWRVRVPRGVKDLSVQVGAVVDELTGDLGRPPSTDEIADRIGVEIAAVEQAHIATAANNPIAADTGEPTGDGGQVIDLREELGDEQARGDVDARLVIGELIEALPERSRRVVWLRFFEDLSQDEIADRLGISQPHVSRLLRASLGQMRRQLGRVH
jgi:RNA polymerase sigma-B factor